MIHKIKVEIEKLKAWQPIATPSLDKLLSFIDPLQEDPVSVWHDASEEPEEGKDFAFVTYDGIMWARYRIEDIFLGWKVFRIQTELDKWAYVSDLLKL